MSEQDEVEGPGLEANFFEANKFIVLAQDYFSRKHPNCRRDSHALNKDVACALYGWKHGRARVLELEKYRDHMVNLYREVDAERNDLKSENRRLRDELTALKAELDKVE